MTERDMVNMLNLLWYLEVFDTHDLLRSHINSVWKLFETYGHYDNYN
jgi:hypothetical protein